MTMVVAIGKIMEESNGIWESLATLTFHETYENVEWYYSVIFFLTRIPIAWTSLVHVSVI